MSLRFQCNSCGKDVTVQFLKPGELAECKNCGAKNYVPVSAAHTSEQPNYEKSGSGSLEVDTQVATGSEEAAAPPVVHRPPEMSYQKMLKQLRSWRIGLIIFGLLGLGGVAADPLCAYWTALALTVALASFYFKDAAILVCFAVVLIVTGLLNIQAGGGWIVLGVFQLLLSIGVFRNFTRVNRAQFDYEHLSDDTALTAMRARKRTATYFPWGGFICGFAGFLGLFVALAAMWIGPTGSLIYAPVTLSILGFAVSLASLLSGLGRRNLSILGLTFSLLTFVLVVVLEVIHRG